jgi:hypothetical protein
MYQRAVPGSSIITMQPDGEQQVQLSYKYSTFNVVHNPEEKNLIV